MQKYSDNLREGDRRAVRKWRLFSAGFYGSILAGLILYAALNQKPEVNYASANLAQAASRASETRH